jgi:hypothetical protein
LACCFDNSFVQSVKATNLGDAFHLGQHSIQEPKVTTRGANDCRNRLRIHFWKGIRHVRFVPDANCLKFTFLFATQWFERKPFEVSAPRSEIMFDQPWRIDTGWRVQAKRDWANSPNEWAILRPSANGITWKR